MQPLARRGHPAVDGAVELVARGRVTGLDQHRKFDLITFYSAIRQLDRLRADFRDFLLEEVKRTLDDGEDARAEIRHLLSLFE